MQLCGCKISEDLLGIAGEEAILMVTPESRIVEMFYRHAA